MQLKCHCRIKDGKEHRYWSLIEKRRCADGRIVDRPVLYLGEINDSQKAVWIRCIAAFDPITQTEQRLALFPADRPIPAHAADYGVQVRLSEFGLHRPRPWGACWLVLQLWMLLQLDRFWTERLPASREGTSWYRQLVVLVAYRLIAPGSEWGYLGNGLSAVRWATCWAKISGGGQRQSLPVSGSAPEAQGPAVRVFTGSVAGSIRREL